MKTLAFAAALGSSLMLGQAASSFAAAQTCTGRSVAVDPIDSANRVHQRPEYIADDLGDVPSSLYARRPQRGRH
jgi:hypothetical protein